MKLHRNFVLAGSCTSAVFMGALNAVDAPRERRRWEADYLLQVEGRASAVVWREASEAFDAARALVRLHGRRVVKRAVVRCSREYRSYERRQRDRGRHFEGRAARALLRDYRPCAPRAS